jgi:hypothetical protein
MIKTISEIAMFELLKGEGFIKYTIEKDSSDMT